ncbi:MAG: hypothetical protein M3270_00110 [Thermoproteota archaeon]|nr:hypothetical protein [Thermoproteota archaeon]
MAEPWSNTTKSMVLNQMNTNAKEYSGRLSAVTMMASRVEQSEQLQDRT